MKRKNYKVNPPEGGGKPEQVVFGGKNISNVPKPRSKRMTSETRTIEKPISQANIDAALGQFLYATGVVHDNERVFDITIINHLDTPIIKFTVQKGD